MKKKPSKIYNSKVNDKKDLLLLSFENGLYDKYIFPALQCQAIETGIILSILDIKKIVFWRKVPDQTSANILQFLLHQSAVHIRGKVL